MAASLSDYVDVSQMGATMQRSDRSRPVREVGRRGVPTSMEVRRYEHQRRIQRRFVLLETTCVLGAWAMVVISPTAIVAAFAVGTTLIAAFSMFHARRDAEGQPHLDAATERALLGG